MDGECRVLASIDIIDIRTFRKSYIQNPEQISPLYFHRSQSSFHNLKNEEEIYAVPKA